VAKTGVVAVIEKGYPLPTGARALAQLAADYLFANALPSRGER